MTTDIVQFFTKADRYFYYLKRVVFSCETPRQLSQTLNWYTTVLNNLSKELDFTTCNYTVRNSTEYRQEFYQRCNLLTKEVNKYVEEINSKYIKEFVYGS